MTSAAQLDANRANAEHSTGPRTEAGKAASSQNARSHGLTARELHIPDHERPEFEAHREGLYHDIKPLGALEHELFDQLVSASWKLRRIQFLEDELFQNEANPLNDQTSAKALDRLNRYQATAERSFQRVLQQLRVVQTNNSLRAALPEVLEEALSGLVDMPTFFKKRPRFESLPVAAPVPDVSASDTESANPSESPEIPQPAAA